MSAVVLQGVSKSYAQTRGAAVTAVHNIDLSVEPGEFMVLVGPSGCGKSTTLRMIAGLEEISGGTIAIDGQVVNDVAPKDRNIAMVFQNYALYPHMSVYDNMAFGLKLRKLPRAEIDARVQEAAAMLGLEPYLERRPKALSGGQRQRVAVGRAIVRKPKVFLFDEPLSNLDAKMRVTTRTEISKLHARLGATMIYVTHDQVEAMTMGDRICVMKDGHIMQVADPLTLYGQPANLFVAGFIGSPPMNLFRGTIHRTPGGVAFATASNGGAPVHIALRGRMAGIAANAIGKQVILGLRPEDMSEAGAAVAGDRPVIEATLEIAEPLGAETYLYLNAAGNHFIARVAPGNSLHHGDTVRIAFDMEKAHLYDATNEAVLA